MEDGTTFRNNAPQLSADVLLFGSLLAVLGVAVYFSVRTPPTAERSAVRGLYQAYREELRGQRRRGSERKQDCDLPENSAENLDRKLDHALEETFPTSDPVSVSITK